MTGAEIFSALLPEDFNFIRYNKEGKVTLDIKNGKLIKGHIDKNTIGQNNGELIREFYRKHGQDRTIELLGRIFKLGIKVLLKYGFSTGLNDTDLPKEAQSKISSMIKKSYSEVEDYLAEYRKGKIERLPGKTELETFEVRAMEILNKARSKIGSSMLEYVGENNPTILMSKSGAKGSTLNFVQMSSCVGQQALGGKRINKGYRNRTLSHFKEGDLGPDARGFVSNSFKTGVSPIEYFFHAMTGRDGLMDTALRTPKSGYLYRRLANALQDLKVEYDQTVRNASGEIVQFKYGEDSIDVSKSEGGVIDVINAMNDILRGD